VTTYTFKACDGVTGTPVAFVPQFMGASISFELSDVGSLSFNYPRSGVNASFLEANLVEIAVFQDGVEMDDGRFTVQSMQDDELDSKGSIRYTGVSLLNMLKKAIVYSADGSITQGVDQTYTSATAGGILKALFDQNKARGANRVMDRITYASFSNTTDSNGNPWAFTLGSITYTVGVDYLSVVRNMVDNGMIEVKMVGRDLRVYNAGTMGADKTVIAEPIVLRKGRDLIEAPRTRTKEAIAAIALVAGDGGILAQYIDSSVAATWGEDEVFISQGGISDSTTLGILSQQAIENVSAMRTENTHKVALNNSPYKPYADYRVSDYIFTDRVGVLDRLRIRQMVLDIDAGGVVNASLVLNDKFLEREIAISRRVNGILGGATATGSVAIPAGPDPGTDTTIPQAPTILSSSSAVFTDPISGKSTAAVSLSWPAVTQNTDLSVISDLDHYETEYRTDVASSAISPSVLSPGRDDEPLTRLFDRRGKGYGWLGADGGASCQDATGMEAFLFADTNLGVADQAGAITQWSFIHNSMVYINKNDPSVFDAKWGYANRFSKEDAWQDTSIGLWQADTNCSVARDTTQFFYGTASLRLTATAAATMTARIAAGAFAYPVTALTRYSVMAKIKQTGTVRSVILGIRWYDSANALLSTSTSSSFAGGSTTSWVRQTYSAVAPVGAVRASMIITVNSAAAGQIIYCDQLGFFQGDCQFGSWNDPVRNGLGGPLALIHPEDKGGTALTAGTIAQQMYWVDQFIRVGSKLYGFMTRYTPAGVFQNSIDIAVWDATTHAFEGLTPWTTSEVVLFGVSCYQDASFLYVYGLDTTDAPATQSHFLLRVPIGNVLGGTKEYSTGTGGGWSTTRASAVENWTSFAATLGGITKIGSTFYGITTIYGDGNLRLLTATNIYGPWTDTGSFYTQPEIGSGLVAYFPRFHEGLNDNNGFSMSYSVNGTVQGVSSTGNIRYYAPKFVRGPKSVLPALTPVTGWSAPRIIESGVLTDNIGNIPPGWNFQARVRAVDSSGNYSVWTEGTAIRTVEDTTPPNKPSTPIVATAFQGLRIEWDGKDYLGGPPPGDWDRIELHISEVANFTPGPLTLVDNVITRLGAVFPVQGLTYGHTYYVRFVAVDVRGNRSTPSDVAQSGLEQLVDTAEIANKLITGAKVAEGTINVNNLTVAAFEPSIVPNGSFETNAQNADGSDTGLPYAWGNSGWTVGGGYTVDFDPTPISGSKSIRLTAATAADGGRYASAKFPVTEGKLLAVQVKVRGSRAVAATNAFEVHVVTGNTLANTGAFPSAGVSDWGTSGTLPATTGIQTLELQRIVPTGMKYAQVFLSINASADGSGWAGTFDDVVVAPVGGSAFIADLSVLNAKIANLAVDNAKIANVSVGKLTAGILSADMTVSARIKTADTGARVELNSAGLQAYNSAGTLTVDVQAASGAATLTGKFQTDFDSSTTPHIMMQNSGDRTTIWFMDNSGLGTSGNAAFMNTPADAGNAPRVGINTGSFFYNGGIASRHRLFLNNNAGIQLETTSAGNNREGWAFDMRDTFASIKGHNTGVLDGYGLHLSETFAEIKNWNAGAQGLGTSITLNESGSSSWDYYISGPVQTGGSIRVDSSGLFMARNGSGLANGGAISLAGTDARFGVYNLGAEATVMYFDDSGHIMFVGAFWSDQPNGGTSGLYCGTWNPGASTSFSVNYGVTMASRPQALYAVHSSAGLGDHRLSVFNTTGFTVLIQNSNAINLNYWNFRTLA
jgi:hypothetical protein